MNVTKSNGILHKRHLLDFISIFIDKGGLEHGVKLFVIRSSHQGSNTPGKMFEYAPPGIERINSNASLAWGGGERFKSIYEVSMPNKVKNG